MRVWRIGVVACPAGVGRVEPICVGVVAIDVVVVCFGAEKALTFFEDTLIVDGPREAAVVLRTRGHGEMFGGGTLDRLTSGSSRTRMPCAGVRLQTYPIVHQHECSSLAA